MTARPKVYLAGPGVFLPHAKRLGVQLKALCDSAGLEGLWPLDNELAGAGALTPGDLAKVIYQSNKMMIGACDAVIADVSPFRGPHLDVGTAWEIGHASALGKPVFGYMASSLEINGYERRVAPLIERIYCEQAADGWRDVHGGLVEDFGLFDNLMIALAVRLPVSASVHLAIARCSCALQREGQP